MILKNKSNLIQRLTVSMIATLFVLASIYLSTVSYFPPVFALIIAASVGFALWEYYQLAIVKGFDPLVKMGIGASILYVIGNFLFVQGFLSPLYIQIFSIVAVLCFCVYYLFYNINPLINLALTIFGLLYITIPISLMLNINYYFHDTTIQDGRWWLFYLITVTKMTDTGAYFTGKKFGKHKLAQEISPKKTIEGAIGGLAFSILTSFAFYFISSATGIHFSITLAESLLLGLCLGVIGQLGDLIESLFKRDAGTKDSNQLPGLGGMLDMIDSLIFTTPVIYFFLKLHDSLGYVS